MDQVQLLTEYDVSVFHDLYDFPIARTILSQLGPAVTALGDVVCAHGLQSSVGANLLHKHFNLQDGEFVLRQFEGRIAKMKPQPIALKAHNDILPYLWEFSDGIYGEHFYPLEYVQYERHVLQEAREEIKLIADNQEFLREFATCLFDLGLEDVFGIVTLCSRYRVQLENHETMLETTDAVNRVLTLEPINSDLLGSYDTTETLWIFTSPDTVAVA